MALSPLLVAGIAAVALVTSVGVDTAFSQTLVVELGHEGQWRELARVGLDSDAYLTGPYPVGDIEPVDRNATVELRVTLHNEYPFGLQKTLTVHREGCYDGAPALATFSVGGSGSSGGVASLSVASLLGPNRFEPQPVDGSGKAPVYANLYVCHGERYLASASIPVEASS